MTDGRRDRQVITVLFEDQQVQYLKVKGKNNI